jgi:hypothetical protein
MMQSSAQAVAALFLGHEPQSPIFRLHRHGGWACTRLYHCVIVRSALQPRDFPKVRSTPVHISEQFSGCAAEASFLAFSSLPRHYLLQHPLFADNDKGLLLTTI